MRVLLVKMSSMGDVIHTLPALTDAARALPDVRFDWVVEQGFAEIPAWHPAVERVFPIRLRQWRRRLWSPSVWREMRTFFDQIAAAGPYDLILDAQGLLKSAFVARKARKALKNRFFSVGQKNDPAKMGETPLIAGFDRTSAREPLAARFYDRTFQVPVEQHAIDRLRQLFAHVLDYPVPQSELDYGITPSQADHGLAVRAPYWVFLHGTTWETKLWPEAYWRELIDHAAQKGIQVVLPWGSEAEHQRSLRLAQGFNNAVVPPQRLSIGAMASLLGGAEQVVAVDTGLAHLAAALNVPTVVLYRVTDPGRVGACGQRVRHLISPLADRYLKRTTPAEAQASLEGLSTENVIDALEAVA